MDTADLQKRREAAATAVEIARKFVADVVSPASVDLDRHVNPEDCFSWDIVEKGSERGLRTLTLMPQYGGAGADCLTTAMVVEELAKGDMGVSVVFAQTLKLIQSFQAAATEDQRARFLPTLRDDPRALMAIGMTEPQTASNYIIPYQPAGFVTSATRKGQGWVINWQEAVHLQRQSRPSLSAVRTDERRQGAERRQHLLHHRAWDTGIHHRTRRGQDGRTAREQRGADFRRLFRTG